MFRDIRQKFFSGGVRRVVENSGWLLFGEVVGLIAKFFLFVYLARVLGPTGFGNLTFALAFVSFFVIGADLGLGTLVNQLYARTDGGAPNIADVLGLKLALMVGAFLVLVGVSFTVPGGDMMRQLVIVFGVFIMLQSFIDFLNSFFRAREQMRYEAVVKIAQTVFVVGAAIAFLVWVNVSPLSVARGYVLGIILTLGVAVSVFTQRITRVVFRVDRTAWVEILRQSLPLGLMAFFAMVYNTIDSILLGYFGQLEAVGMYNAALKIVGVVVLPATVVIRSAFSAWSRLASEKADALKQAWQKVFIFVLGYMLPVLAGSAVVGSEMMKIVFGDFYGQSGGLLSLLLVAATLNTMVLLHMFLSVALEERKRVLRVAWVGALVNIVLNILMIPEFGALGAAWATIVATLIMLIQYRHARHDHSYRKVTAWPWAQIAHLGVATAGMLVLVAGLQLLGMPTAALIGIGVASYILFLMKVLGRFAYEK